MLNEKGQILDGAFSFVRGRVGKLNFFLTGQLMVSATHRHVATRDDVYRFPPNTSPLET